MGPDVVARVDALVRAAGPGRLAESIHVRDGRRRGGLGRGGRGDVLPRLDQPESLE